MSFLESCAALGRLAPGPRAPLCYCVGDGEVDRGEENRQSISRHTRVSRDIRNCLAAAFGTQHSAPRSNHTIPRNATTPSITRITPQATALPGPRLMRSRLQPPTPHRVQYVVLAAASHPITGPGGPRPCPSPCPSPRTLGPSQTLGDLISNWPDLTWSGLCARCLAPPTGWGWAAAR